MASSGGDNAGSGGSSAPKRKRVDALGKFSDLYWKRFKDNPKPSDVNALCGEAGQTATCAHKAIDAYNKENGTEFEPEKGGDSNAFTPGGSPDIFYVHLNFDAVDPTKGKHTFFAELKGLYVPSGVTMVVSLGNTDDEVQANSADHNCIYCTGLRHSLTQEFEGFNENADLE